MPEDGKSHDAEVDNAQVVSQDNQAQGSNQHCLATRSLHIFKTMGFNTSPLVVVSCCLLLGEARQRSLPESTIAFQTRPFLEQRNDIYLVGLTKGMLRVPQNVAYRCIRSKLDYISFNVVRRLVFYIEYESKKEESIPLEDIQEQLGSEGLASVCLNHGRCTMAEDDSMNAEFSATSLAVPCERQNEEPVLTQDLAEIFENKKTEGDSDSWEKKDIKLAFRLRTSDTVIDVAVERSRKKRQAFQKPPHIHSES
nr:uncharacterized protein LOC119179025 [Rhipicephalus microplus]